MQTINEINGLQPLLEPQNIAIIGASNDPNKIGGRPIDYLKKYGYKGDIFPINPKYSSIQSITCYPSILQVQKEIDLAIIAVPGSMVIDTLHMCGEKKVKSAVIFSSGFAEIGEEGRKAQEQIKQIAKTYKMRIMGPNCQGVGNFKTGSIATFTTSLADGKKIAGSGAIISQSGAVAAMLYNILKQYGRGVKYWIGTGNEADINVSELINYMIDDPEVNVLQVYIEDVKDSVSLIKAAEKSKKMKKPILALKSGRTLEGSKAASSHTGALASEDIVFDAVFSNYGIVRVDSVVELGLFSQVFELRKVPKGKKVAIISNSGGLGVMMIDKCKEMGLDLASFSNTTIQKLSEVLPVFVTPQNPIDVATQLLNDKDLLEKIMTVLKDDQNVDIILIGLGIIGQGYDVPKMIEHVSAAQKDSDAIIALTGVGCQKEILETFSRRGVPSFEDPNLCIKAVASYVKYHKDLQNEFDNESFEPLVTSNMIQLDRKGYLNEFESKALLKQWNLPTTREILCTSAEEAKQAAETIGFPIVMKVSSKDIQHKTEIGGIVLNIQNEEQIKEAFNKIMSNATQHVNEEKIDGILVQEMILDKGFEISLGVKRDRVFGPIIMIASGGIYIEVLKDFKLLVPPLNYSKVKDAVNSLVMAPLLKGARGKKPLDLPALYETIISFSKFVTQIESIEEVDLNPVIVLEEGKGVRIVDSIIKFKE